MSHPIISFLIPAYNVAPFISSCLDSILALPISKEIIIVNDGSTDDTATIIEEYATQYDTIHVYHQQNGGVSSARNLALSHANGEWVAFIDGDDVVINDTDLHALLTIAHQHQVDIIKGLYMVSGRDRPNRVKQPTLDQTREDKITFLSSKAYLEHCVGEMNMWAIGSVFIRRSVITALHLNFRTDLIVCEDPLFFYQLLSTDLKLMEVPYVLYHYQQRVGSASNSKEIRVKSINAYARYLTALIEIAQKQNDLSSRYIQYCILSTRLDLTRHYQNLLNAGYSIAQANHEPFSRWILSEEEYTQALKMKSDILRTQRGKTYYHKRDIGLDDITLPQQHYPAMSFVVPIYNVAPYLAECIDSLIRQKLDKEIILVDDGSTDNSLDIAMDYARRYPFITVIHSKNEGLSAARNKGLQLARGEYIQFIDSDDYLLDQPLIEILFKAKKANAPIVRLDYRTQTMIPVLPAEKFVLSTATDYFKREMLDAWQPSVCKMIIQRDFLIKHQIKFFEGILAEDAHFTTLLCLSDPTAKVLETNLICYFYRRRDDSITLHPTKRYGMGMGLLITIKALQQWFDMQTHQDEIRPYMDKFYDCCLAIAQRFMQEESE
ncbi:glycosyltransferase family 2 protein [Pelistega suis]|uniref:Glycosyltransferase n=1 Tax=Pelistega suis TaxID=1631957 RepID=A0A849P3W9_9BURK|nr:glycosyltransferase [Pelistega suis]NOL51341.1 glycosyltransferase [Pelistega suis]